MMTRKIYISVLCMLFTISSCTCTNYHCYVISGKKRYRNITVNNIVQYLQTEQPGNVGGFARFTGLFFTGFKKIGIYGWYDYHLHGEVSGTVVGRAYSTDKLKTIDVLIESLKVNDTLIENASSKYLRAEICTRKKTGCTKILPDSGTSITLKGKIVWDGDGHLEIHPTCLNQ